MRRQDGWTVTPSTYGLPTAWVAVYEYDPHPASPSAAPPVTVSFNAEMDALVGIDRSCGHNLIATSSLAAALATAHVVKQRSLPAKIVLYGTRPRKAAAARSPSSAPAPTPTTPST